MRIAALGVILGAVMMVAGQAAAAPWADPNGRVVFDAPRSWVMTVERSDTQTVVVAGDANNECYVIANPNAVTASASMAALDRTIRDNNQFSDEAWLRLANSIGPMFPGNSAQLISRSIDESGPWPMQRANLQAPRQPVTAMMQLRPGMDLIALCWSYGGPDPTATFEAFMRSIAHPNDAEFAARRAAEAAAAPPAN